MYSKKFTYGISAVMVAVGLVTISQDRAAEKAQAAPAQLAAFNAEATATLNGQYLLIEPTAAVWDVQGGDMSASLQDTSSVWIQQSQIMNVAQGSSQVLQSAYIEAME